LAAALVCPFLLGVFKAEAQTRKLEFEVASVKPTALDRLSLVRQSASGEIRVGTRIYGDRAEYIYMTLRQLIDEAYQVRSFQVAGPDSVTTERFDVICKMPAGSLKGDAPLMLQSLLADRFKLAVHREFREQDVLALVVGKGGPKFRESPSEAPLSPGDTKEESPEGAGQAASGRKDGSINISGTFGITGLRATLDYANSSVHVETSRMTMPHLADLVMRTTFANDRPVVDMTGLKGNYEVTFDFPMAALGMRGATAAGVTAANAQGPRPAEAASDPGSVGVLRAIRSLGLDLERRKAPVEQLIVDHVEKVPTEN
jgi:uncharacterized protein (TIGR03435 family)